MYVKSLRKEPLIVGLAVGVSSGIYMVEAANNFGAPTSSLFTSMFGPLYIAVIALALNLLVSFVGCAILNKRASVSVKGS
jgi:SSS family solute:Na+ symporter